MLKLIMRNYMNWGVFFIVIVFIFISCEKDEEQKVGLDDQIGQMLLVGFRGTTISYDHHIVSDLEDYNLGGVILYEKDVPSQSSPRNIESPEQLKQLTADLKHYSKENLFIAIDQEGGIVNRLKASYSFPASVSAQYLGQLNNEDSTRYHAALIASTLKSMGININFAPVVDLNLNPESPAIGALERSFSANVDTVVFHAGLYIDEHKANGILTCCKHFPGHGSASADSHLGLVDLSETWKEIELEPYKQLIGEQKCEMIMTAHVFNLNLDADYPATLSKKILTGMLREQLEYNGVIVSDAMEMGAITDNYGQKEAIEKAINAGCDVLLFSNNTTSYNEDIVPQAITFIKELINEGKITEEQIQQSYDLIMELKNSLK
jgi:beta-N-acetylhexosaminidase